MTAKDHPAISRAETLLGKFHPEIQGMDYPVDCLLQVDPTPAASPRFSIRISGNQLVFHGDRPRSLFAGVAYFLHHLKRNSLPALPIERKGRSGARLVIEDFPFHCYAPAGLNFDPGQYAANLAALGFSSMECNRLHPGSRAGSYFDAYQLTNPSPAAFAWTDWHEGVWDKDEIARNAEELDRCIKLALEFDLEPALTSFVPRPYPETFFQRHPHLRGPNFRHRFLQEGNHPAVSSLDTDHPETLRFYRTIYAELFNRYPRLGHLCFWHGDLGTQFWKNGEGPRGRSLAARMAEFHGMIAGLLTERGMQTQVWMNPWALPKECLGEINEALPASVGFTVKDNPGVEIITGSHHYELGDATVITSRIGSVPQYVKQLAEQKGRRVCLGQYLDFSEDLDPIPGVPHPIMTFRKLRISQHFGATDASANWGIISPDIVPENPNQDVLREWVWGDRSENFASLLPRILPGGLHPAKQQALLRAWTLVDEALQSWPQFWGLRLQDSGVRLRWLIRPLLPAGTELEEAEREFYLRHQVYRINAPDLSTAFMDLPPEQALETSWSYIKMIERLREAEAVLEEAGAGESGGIKQWIGQQSVRLKLLRYFWTTYANHLAFIGANALLQGDDVIQSQYRSIRAELENVGFTIGYLESHPEALLGTSRDEWAQCFGPNFTNLLRHKRSLMERALLFT